MEAAVQIMNANFDSIIDYRMTGTLTSGGPKRPSTSSVTSHTHTHTRQHVNPQTTNMLEPVSLENRVVIAIYRLASNVEFHDVANLFGIGASTACNISWEVCEALSKLRVMYGKRPKTVHEMKAVMTGLEKKTGFPMCAGALARTYPSLPHRATPPTITTERGGTVLSFKDV